MLTTILLCLLGAVCIAGSVLAIQYALKCSKSRQPQQPLPGSEGGGFYVLTVEGLQSEADARKLKAALCQIPGIHSRISIRTGEVRIRYEGFPALDLLDSLRARAEHAGFTVKSIR